MRVNQLFRFAVITSVSAAVALALTLPTATRAKSLPDRQPALLEAANNRADQSKGRKLAKYIQEKYKLSAAQSASLINEAYRGGETHGVDPVLILAMMAVESNFRDNIISPRNTRAMRPVSADVRLQQVKEIANLPAAAKVDRTLQTGVSILADYLKDHNGNLRTALLSYSGNLKNPKSSYPDKVLRVYQDFMQSTW